MSSLPSIQIACPAKVNLALSVGAPVAATGMHPIASWMAALEFRDVLNLTAADSGGGGFDLAFAADAPLPQAVDWPLEKDLAFRAHGLLEEHLGRPLPVRAVLRKRIPAGAGLGGGSSDAAGMLVGLDRLFRLDLPAGDLRGLAGRLGSDVAFLVGALGGCPSALVTGLGEQLEPAPLTRPLHLVLAFPSFGCPTGEVYRAFDQSGAVPPASAGAPDLARVRRLTRLSPLPPDAPFNDLAAPACRVRPALAEHRRQLAQVWGRPVHITGSGSTLFALAPDAAVAMAMAREASARTGLPALATRTLAVP